MGLCLVSGVSCGGIYRSSIPLNVINIYKIPDKAYEERLSNDTELLQMEEFMNRPVSRLSLGQRMRAEIALALIHNPKILFLDEPTIGLDVVGKHRIREFLKHINQMNQTTIL